MGKWEILLILCIPHVTRLKYGVYTLKIYEKRISSNKAKVWSEFRV